MCENLPSADCVTWDSESGLWDNDGVTRKFYFCVSHLFYNNRRLADVSCYRQKGGQSLQWIFLVSYRWNTSFLSLPRSVNEVWIRSPHGRIVSLGQQSPPRMLAKRLRMAGCQYSAKFTLLHIGYIFFLVWVASEKLIITIESILMIWTIWWEGEKLSFVKRQLKTLGELRRAAMLLVSLHSQQKSTCLFLSSFL